MVRLVIVRAEYRAEAFAGGCVDGVEETPHLGVVRSPIILDRDATSVGQNEGGDIDGIGEGMTRQPRCRRADRIAAGISAERLDLDQPAAENLIGGGRDSVCAPLRAASSSIPGPGAEHSTMRAACACRFAAACNSAQAGSSSPATAHSSASTWAPLPSMRARAASTEDSACTA